MNFFTKFFALGAVFAATGAMADPFCAALSDTDQLPKKYAKRGPFYADAQSGWIVGADQLKASYDVTPEVTALWQAIKDEFDARGATLTVLAAPPRPLFAPANVLPESYAADADREAFTNYIGALNKAGIAAPDLTQVLESSASQDYYFKRDTHWTPSGAYASAKLLGTSLNVVATKPNDAPFDQSYDEKGSLSAVVENTCGMRPERETVAAPSYAVSGGAGALLADTKPASIALVGTSFSDRYKTDSYQVAGALAHVFGEEVQNLSATGGGMVGAMEAFILSGALEQGNFNTVVWETPYTTPLTNVSGLRQVLGALQKPDALVNIYTGDIGRAWQSVKHDISAAGAASLQITTPGVTTGKLSVELFGAEGEKMRVKLVKSDRIDLALQNDVWRLSLATFPIKGVNRIKLKLDQPVAAAEISLIN